MYPSLSEIITLVSFGNEYLISGELKSSDQDHILFRSCNYLEFREIQQGTEKIVGENPLAWFDFLRNSGCQKLRLYYDPERKNLAQFPPALLASFEPMTPWFMEAIYPKGSDYWMNRQDVIYPEKLEGKLWAQGYGKVLNQGKTVNLQHDPELVRDRFKGILEKLISFTQRLHLDTWHQRFLEAHHSLIDEKIAQRYDALIVSRPYHSINNQLMLAVGQADVFGGMGSWSDLGGFSNPEDNQLYEELSEELAKVRDQAIIAAINHDKSEIEEKSI